MFTKIKNWLTLHRATKIYLWWVVIRFFLRWAATILFLMWIWFLAPEYKKNEFKAKLKFKNYIQKIEWSNTDMIINIGTNNICIQYGLMEDGSIRWRKSEKTEFNY